MDSELIFLKLPPENIVYIKFILESYEGIGLVRTLNADKGEMVVIVPSNSVMPFNELIKSLESDLSVRIIPMPSTADQDWLVAEYLQN